MRLLNDGFAVGERLGGAVRLRIENIRPYQEEVLIRGSIRPYQED